MPAGDNDMPGMLDVGGMATIVRLIVGLNFLSQITSYTMYFSLKTLSLLQVTQQIIKLR